MWNFDSPSIVQLDSSSINSIISLDEEVWVACGQHTYILPVEESYYLVCSNMFDWFMMFNTTFNNISVIL